MNLDTLLHEKTTASPSKARSTPPAVRSAGIFQVWAIILSALYLYLNLFSLANVPYFSGGDQTFFWSYALRLSEGQHAYRDFFQFTPPGTDFVFLGLFRCFGADVRVASVAVLLLGVLLCWLCYRVAAHYMDRSWALLTSASYLILVYGRILDATHHWFSLAAVLCAIWILLPHRTSRRVIAAGLLLAIASFFTQTTGVAGLLGISAGLLLERRFAPQPWRSILRLQLLLLASFALTCAVEYVYFVADVGWRQLWYLWVTYPQRSVIASLPLRSESSSNSSPLGVLTFVVQHYFPFAIMLCAYPWSFWYALRRTPTAPANLRAQLALLSSTGCLLMLEVMIKPNWHRIAIVSMPAIILLLWSIAGHLNRVSAGKAAVGILLACLGLRHTLSVHAQLRDRVVLPGEYVALVDHGYGAEFAWLAQHTRPGDLFFDSSWPLLYLPLQLRNPVFVDGLGGGPQTPPSWVELTIRQLEATNTKLVLWSPWLSTTAKADSLKPYRDYLRHHYARIEVFPTGDEVWRAR
jgi:hypothetical protein